MVACDSGPPSRADDARTYAAVLAEPSEDASEDLGRCGLIGDPTVAGECVLVVVQRMAEQGKSPPEDGCSLVTEQPWANECWFLAAEHWGKRGDTERAAALCAKAGTFSEDCAQHLWQDDMYALVRRQGSRVLPKRLARAQQIHDQWAPVMAGTSDFSPRYWRRFYEVAFEPDRPLDVAICEELPPQHRQLCRLGAGRVYVIRLQDRNRDQRPGFPHICTMDPLDPELLGRAQPGMEVMANPWFDALLAEQHQALCVDKKLDMSELAGPEAFREALAADWSAPAGSDPVTPAAAPSPGE